MRARIAAFGVLVVLLTVSIIAQVGTITGVARDAQGLALPGVTVEVASPMLIEKVRTTVTGDDGRYRIVSLPAGTYTVTFKLDGFTEFRRTGVEVTSDVTTSVDARLQVGSLTETVMVEARASDTDVRNVGQRHVFTGAEILQLPTTRNLGDLIQLVPGISIASAGGNSEPNNCGGGCSPIFQGFNSHSSMNDASSINQGRMQVDGLGIQSFGGGGHASYIADVGNAQEVTFTLSGALGESETGGTAITPEPPPNRESYAAIAENPFRRVADAPLSTFSIDVDTASYANVRRFLNGGNLPPRDAVRVEEMVNYFRFDYAKPKGKTPFSITTELAEAPWNPRHRLALIGLQGRALQQIDPAPRNLVFLLDVSGSMSSPDKLPLVRDAMRMLVEALEPHDRVAIVVYAGASGLVLASTPGDRKAEIHAAIERLQSGGSTNGGAGIRLAYRMAREHFIDGGVNRVILATDGDFNVGITSRADLIALIEEQRQSGVFLSVLGVGTGNLQDATMEQLADKGNGNYSYRIRCRRPARCW